MLNYFWKVHSYILSLLTADSCGQVCFLLIVNVVQRKLWSLNTQEDDVEETAITFLLMPVCASHSCSRFYFCLFCFSFLFVCLFLRKIRFA